MKVQLVLQGRWVDIATIYEARKRKNLNKFNLPSHTFLVYSAKWWVSFG